MIYIGTSGFSYDDWREVFYPHGLDKRDFLSFYAREFPALELNSSFYAMPSPALIRNLIENTPGTFQIVIKAFQGITHERDESVDRKVKDFLDSSRPLAESGKLAAVLLQFPYSLHYGEREMAFLDSLLAKFSEVNTVVEFRNSAWLKREALELLRSHNAALCCVDEPRLPGLMPPEVVCTSRELGYVRFHGRNAAKWWHHDQAWERYDYYYRTEELQEWVKNIKWLDEKTGKTFLFFNNHRQGQAVKNAREMKQVLSLAGLETAPSHGGEESQPG